MELLAMTGICKSFFGVPVLKDVALSLEPGEVHALLGENGAGKSTLMNILGGVHERDSGTITLDGRPLTKINPNLATEFGIAFVHQELNLFNDLRVYENIFLREEIVNRFGRIQKQRMIQEVAQLFERLGVKIDPTAIVGELDTSSKQLLEIAKALRRDAKVFILDEPTTALGNQEIEHLFEIVRRLKEQGKSFIFISHKMPEIFRIADRYTVLRNGLFVETGRIGDTTPEAVTRKMVGEHYGESAGYTARGRKEPVLELDRLSGQGFSDVTFTVHRGEIFSVTGLAGSGCSELMQCLFGLTKPTGGRIRLFGEPYAPHGVHAAMRRKVAMLPSNRKENSILPDMTLLENCYVSEHTLTSREQHIKKAKELKKYTRLSDLLGVRSNGPSDLIVSLSGGNQQKVILARWLNTDAEIYLLDNPTQGIDVGAKAEIYRLIAELSAQGKTVIVNTLEIGEIQKISDRCAVFYHGSLQTLLDREQINEETVMLYATNVKAKAEVEYAQ